MRGRNAQNRLPPLVKAPITREQLRLYAEASHDNNAIHLDDEAARKAGLPGVIAHGMLTMAFMGEFLHQALDSLKGRVGPGCQGAIGEMSCHFKAMTLPGDVITITGFARPGAAQEGVSAFECDLEASNERGEVTATGQAVLEFR